MKHPPQCQIDLKGNERIVAVIPETITGAGYFNKPLWVHIYDYSTLKYRQECIQPEQQTPTMRALFRTLESAHDAMCSQIKGVLVLANHQET